MVLRQLSLSRSKLELACDSDTGSAASALHRLRLPSTVAPHKPYLQKKRNIRKFYREKEWTFTDLVKYFDGNKVDAAAQVFDKTFRYCMSGESGGRYPTTPLSSSVSSTVSSPARLRGPLLSETDPLILDPLTPKISVTMLGDEIRCNKCHRYMEGAPDPSLGHEGSAGDARCVQQVWRLQPVHFVSQA